jgi:hypothetical protein
MTVALHFLVPHSSFFISASLTFFGRDAILIQSSAASKTLTAEAKIDQLLALEVA